MREGHFARHIRRMRLLYDQRRTALVGSLHEQFGQTLQVQGAEAGMHLLVTLPKGMRDIEIATRAAAEKLWLAPLSPYYFEEATHEGFILGFGGTPASEIPQAVQKLKAVLRQ
jgi:GntR family transcriptional regulator/MocR family aminotransferase